MNLSVIILTKNEEGNIIDCIESVNLIAEEIIIVDDYSTDRTVEVVRKLNNRKIKIFSRRLDDNFSEQRNFGLSKAKNDWVLFLDADERLSGDLSSEIREKISERSDVQGYFIKRTDNLWGRDMKYGELANITLLRLARKGEGKWRGKVHEVWKVNGKVKYFKNPILHFPHKTLKEFISEVNFYSTLRALELKNTGINPSIWQIIFYPKVKFIINYFLKLGFLDGLAGLVFALMMSLHSFLVRSKLWLYQK